MRRLEADGLTTLMLDPLNGWKIQSLDFGFPEVRADEQGRVDQDGVDDRTAHHGARAVSMTVGLFPPSGTSKQEMLDQLRGFCRPGLRVWFFDTFDDGTERRIRLRADQGSAPLTAYDSMVVQVGWRAPDGVLEASDEESATADATPDVAAGRTYPLVFPRVYPSSSPLGTADVVNAGNTTAYPVLKLYGPCTGPRIENQTTGGLLSFPDIELAGGEWIEVDTRDRTIRLNGLANQSRYGELDLSVSSWWTLAAGTNTVRYFPASFGDGCEAVLMFRSAWL